MSSQLVPSVVSTDKIQITVDGTQAEATAAVLQTFVATAPAVTGGTITGAAVSGGTIAGSAITGGSINGATIGATTPVQAQTYRPINAQTGTTYTLALADNGKRVTLTNSGAITLTVPTNASVAFPVGAEIDLAQLGAGLVTVAAAGGVTLHSLSAAVTLTGQYGWGKLVKTATDTWLLTGSLT
jgi:hypothetical protein